MTRSVPKLAVALLLIGACSPKEVPIVETRGDCGPVFTGQVCTWARTQGDSLLDIGALVPLAAIDSAPAEAHMAWPPVAEAKLKLPQTSSSKSGMTQLSVFWEAMGHPPAFFATPHFDFHFYLVPPGEEMAYDCKDLSKPSTLSDGYSLPDQPLPPELVKLTGVSALTGLCVPTMGMHALRTVNLDAKDTMRGDMVIGYYAGKPIFIEPMLSRAMLLEKKSFSLPIPAIPGLTGNYPRSFRADFDEASQTYRFVFSGFAPGS